MVALDCHQRTIGGNAASHAGYGQLGKQLQPLQGQARGRLGGRQQFRLRGSRCGCFAGKVIEEAIRRRIHVHRVVIVIQRRFVVTFHACRAVTDVVIQCGWRAEWLRRLFHRTHRYGLELHLWHGLRGNNLCLGLTDRLRRRSLRLVPR
ncbi:hypothetical protein D9M71_278530 [compost metagenome]